MINNLEELLNKCEPYLEGTPFDGFYLISPGEPYTGFWGENGFNRIYIVCYAKEDEDEEEKYYIIGKDYQVDCVQLGLPYFNPIETIRVEISSSLNIPYFWTFKSIKFVCKSAHVSDITIEILHEEE